VFIKEQGFQPGWEPDEDDKISKQFIGMADDKIVSTARFREISNGEIKIERMVTQKDYRGKGIGTGLIKFMIDDIKRLRPRRIWLRSQVQSQKFYEECDFKVVSEPFDMWGVPHIDMDYVNLS
jgi:predicted GNAT family N-acyltransferase